MDNRAPFDSARVGADGVGSEEGHLGARDHRIDGAPFVGLLGTVVGVISAFQGIAASGSGGIGSVSAGISEALVETALGLVVAIPAVWFYNYLTGRIEYYQRRNGQLVVRARRLLHQEDGLGRLERLQISSLQRAD